MKVRPLQSSILLSLIFMWLCPAAEPARPPEVQPGTLFERIIEINRIQEPEINLDEARKTFANLVDTCRQGLKNANTPEEKAAVLIKAILSDRDVKYLSNKTWRDTTVAASLLRKSGNCMSTTMLFVCVGDALSLPLKMVRVPHHVYARWENGAKWINIETTRKDGHNYADPYYFAKDEISLTDMVAQKWSEALTTDECFGHLLETTAGFLRSQGRLSEASTMLSKAESLMPFRKDLRLSRISLDADLSGNRKLAEEQITLLMNDKRSAPSLRMHAAVWLASEFELRRDYPAERAILLKAYADAPKADQVSILNQLSFCFRSMRDHRSALRFMELASAGEAPRGRAGALSLLSLAIMQHEDGLTTEAMQSIDNGLVLNPESWHLQILKAGYLHKAGKPDEAFKLFNSVEKPRDSLCTYESMCAWFFAVTNQTEKFYEHFEAALKMRSRYTLTWIDQDAELDRFKADPRFINLVDDARKSVLSPAIENEPTSRDQ